MQWAVDTVKYYGQNNYWTALAYGKARAYLQPWISTEFNAHEIAAGLWLGDIATAHNEAALLERGITHVVCAVLGVSPPFPDTFAYMTVPVRDIHDEDMLPHLASTCAFIDDALAEGGRVLVHCVCGVSRSATITAAWLLRDRLRASVAAGEALGTASELVERTINDMRAVRGCVDPNPAFREQLRAFAEGLLAEMTAE